MFNGSVEVDPHQHLTPTSTVTIVDCDRVVTAPVPEKCPDHGLSLFWHRVAEALRPVGWRLDRVGPTAGWVHDDDVIRFRAAPIKEK